MDQLLLIDKPAGMSSFGVIRELRKRLGIKKMGHAGTLDPLATGLLIIGVGTATKQLTALIGLEKEYLTDIRFGEQRTTGDLEGEIIAEEYVSAMDETVVRDMIDGMVGTWELPVSAYSAIKLDGVPMYKRARKAAKEGKQFLDVPMRTMSVYEAELLSLSVENGRAVASVRFRVSSGTYIRSLAEECGRRLALPATVASLRRTKVGEFTIDNATPLAQVKKDEPGHA